MSEDRGLNPHWLQDHQAHQAHQVRLRQAARSTINPPRPEVAEALAAVPRGEHDDRVEQLVGDMLDTTPPPGVRGPPGRARPRPPSRRGGAPRPGSPSCEQALDHLEARTR